MKKEVELYDFQQYAVYQSLLQEVFFLGLPTGVGKTVVSLTSFFYYRTVYPDTKLLITTTSSALFQFAEEINKFFQHSLKVAVIHQSIKQSSSVKFKEARKKIISDWGSKEGVDIILLSHSMFRIEKENLKKAILSLKKQQINSFLILDEATVFKSFKTQISKAVQTLCSIADKKLCLTATLTKGKLDEIFSMFKNVGISLCNTLGEFEKHYCIVWKHPKIFYLKRYRGFKNISLFREKIDPFCLILKKSDVSASLPPLQIQKRFLSFSEEQNVLLKEIYSGMVALTSEGFDYTDIENNTSQKLLQALTEVGYIKRALQTPEIVAPERFYENSPKTEELLRMLEEDFTDEKIIVYTPSKKYLHLLMHTIKKSKQVPNFYKKPLEISGDVPADVRYENVQLFSNTREHNIFCIDSAGNSAVNLQAGSVLILMSLPDSWGDLIQLVGRISRIGSTHKSLLLVFLLHEDSQDFDEYCILQKQGVLFQAIHGEVEKGLLDTSVLRGIEHTGITDEEFVSQSVSHLLIGTRKRRAEQFA